MGYCKHEDCIEPVWRSDLCRFHFKRAENGTDLNRPRRARTEFAQVQEAAIGLADAETEKDYKRAKDRLRGAAEKWVRAKR